MNIVFVSPHFPPNYWNFCAALKREGATVLGIGDGDFSSLRPELRGVLDWYYHVPDMRDYDKMLRACGFFTHRFGKIDRIESLNEYWLGSDALLRRDFNVFGVKPEQIPALRLKSEMKKIFARAGVLHARGRLVPDLPAAKACAAELGYPVIIKPDDGIGATLAFPVPDESRLAEIWPLTAGKNMLMEEKLDGSICTFDGLTGLDGDIVFCTSHVYGQSPMDMLQSDGDISYYSVRDIPQDLEAAGRKLVAEFGVRERFFHLEFFRRPGGELYAMEVNMRPPGGMTMDMFNYACDADLYSAWAHIIARGEPPHPIERKFYCAYAGRKNNLRYRHSHDESMARFGALMAAHGPMPEAFGRYMGHYGYILRSAEKQPLLDALEFIQKPA
jgi:hypothetical protein